MVIKLYISGISGNKEVKKKQQRVQMILDSKQIDYEAIDITEPGKEKDKEFMQQNGKVRESLGKYPLPPQIFNDEDFCGDYEDFDLANEVDELEKFLHIETSAKDSETNSKPFEESKNNGLQKEMMIDMVYNPYEYHTVKVQYNGVNGLKEEITSHNDMPEDTTEDVTKTEVNGEHSTVSEIPAENEAKNVETSAEAAIAPQEEESSTKEEKTNEDEGENEKEESAEDNQKQEIEGEREGEGKGEASEQVEEKEEIETPKEEKEIEEETSPPLEEKEADEDKEDKEKVESEKEEEKESDDESPQSEKSQAD